MTSNIAKQSTIKTFEKPILVIVKLCLDKCVSPKLQEMAIALVVKLPKDQKGAFVLY